MVQGRLYVFCVVAFGFSCATSALLRALEKVLKNVREFTLNFIDDLSVLSGTFEEHIQHLDTIFKTLIENNITLNFSKCKFFKKEVKFLGFILSEKGLSQDPDKLKKIREYKRPKNIKQLQAYLGTINFYSKFSENYAKETYPLYQLLKKDAKFKWTPELDEAFERTKNLFIQERTLTFPDLEKDYYLIVDSSCHSIAGILSQYDDNGIEKIITIVSRTLKGCELAYTVSEWELLSIVFCMRKLYTYLYGANVI